MKLTAQIKLQPSTKQAADLRATLERANDAANRISDAAWQAQTFQQFALHTLVYHPVRGESGLAAQMVVRLIAKVADAYKLDRSHQRRFRPHGSIAYDDRILTYGDGAVSIWTTGGRQRIAFTCGEHQRRLLASRQGESDLVFRDGDWYLYATVNYEEPPPMRSSIGSVSILASSTLPSPAMVISTRAHT